MKAGKAAPRKRDDGQGLSGEPGRSGRKDAQIREIVDAALAEIDEHGLELFTIRRLAKRLNVYPATIYWYMGSKEIILSEVLKLVMAPTAIDDLSGFWRDRLRLLFQRVRSAIRAHPHTASLIGGTLVPNATADLRFVESVLRIVSDAGLTGPLMVAGYNSIIAALVGFVSEEFAVMPEKGTEPLRALIEKRLYGLPHDSYPLLQENLPLMLNRTFVLRWENGATAPMDRSFSHFTDMIVLGIEGLVATSKVIEQSRSESGDPGID